MRSWQCGTLLFELVAIKRIVTILKRRIQRRYSDYRLSEIMALNRIAAVHVLLTTALLCVLWAMSLIGIFYSPDIIMMMSTIGVAIYFTSACVLLRKITLLIVSLLLILAIVLSLHFERINLLWSGLGRAVMFAAFLPTLALLRSAVREGAKLEVYRRQLEQVSPKNRPIWIVNGAYILASVLSVGSSAIFSSVLREGTPENERIAQARANVCGASLALIWSPFFVALAVVSDFLPNLSLLSLIGSGVLVSLLGLFVATRIYSGVTPISGNFKPVIALSGFALPIALTTILVIVVRSAFGLSTIQTMLITLPILCAAYLAYQGRARIITARREVWSAMERMHDDVAAVTAAMIFGVVLSGTPWMDGIRIIEVLGDLPVAAIVGACVLVMALLGFVGVQPLVAGTICLIVLTSGSFGLTDLAIGISVLAGWSASSMLSVSSLLVRVTAAQHEVPPEKLVIGRNIVFFVAFLPLVVLVVMGINGFA